MSDKQETKAETEDEPPKKGDCLTPTATLLVLFVAVMTMVVRLVKVTP